MDKDGRRKNFFRIYLTVALTLTAIFFLPQILRIGPSLYASMEEVHLCNGPASQPLSSVPDHPLGYIINISMLDQLYACGFLKTDGQEAKIGLYVEDENGVTVDHYFERYRTGYVFMQIRINDPKPGTYFISIVYGRNVLATSKFVITTP